MPSKRPPPKSAAAAATPVPPPRSGRDAVPAPPLPTARPARWSRLKLCALAAVIGIGVGFVAMATVDLLLPWSTPINVPDMPLEQLRALSAPEREALMRAGTFKVRTIDGLDKALYVARAAPAQLRNDWIAYALACFAAALLCGWVVDRRRKA